MGAYEQLLTQSSHLSSLTARSRTLTRWKFGLFSGMVTPTVAVQTYALLHHFFHGRSGDLLQGRLFLIRNRKSRLHFIDMVAVFNPALVMRQSLIVAFIVTPTFNPRTLSSRCKIGVAHRNPPKGRNSLLHAPFTVCFQTWSPVNGNSTHAPSQASCTLQASCISSQLPLLHAYLF